MQQKIIENIFATKTGASGNNIEKEPQKPSPELKKTNMLNVYREYLLCLQEW